MKIKLLAFGPAKNWIGKSQQVIDIPKGMLLNELLPWLKVHHHPIPESVQYVIAINQTYVDSSSSVEIKDGDEIAIIPPVSGG